MKLVKTLYLLILLNVLDNICAAEDENSGKRDVVEMTSSDKEGNKHNEIEEQVAFKPTTEGLEVIGSEKDGDHSRIKRKSKKGKTHDPKDENYHVKYETKFAFQNVDDQGLRVKYNKTENVFYGQAAPAGGTEDSCVDTEGRILKRNDVISVKGQCRTDVCMGGGVWKENDVCNTNECTVDLTKDFPDCCVCRGLSAGAYPQGFGQMPPPQYGQYQQAPMPIQQYSAPPAPANTNNYQSGSLGQYHPPAAAEEGGYPGEESLEMRECRKIHFLDTEEVKPIPGMCIMCHKGLGTYRYVEGCPRIDCDEFIPGNPNDEFPQCCPMCKGSNREVGFTWNAPKPAGGAAAGAAAGADAGADAGDEAPAGDDAAAPEE